MITHVLVGIRAGNRSGKLERTGHHVGQSPACRRSSNYPTWTATAGSDAELVEFGAGQPHRDHSHDYRAPSLLPRHSTEGSIVATPEGPKALPDIVRIRISQQLQP